MKLLSLALSTLVVNLSFADICTTIDGIACSVNHPYSKYLKANPCFVEKWKNGKSKNVCFYDETNTRIEQCDCSVDACDCAQDTSSRDPSSDSSSRDPSSDSSSRDPSSDSSSRDPSSRNSFSGNSPSQDSSSYYDADFYQDYYDYYEDYYSSLECEAENTTYCKLGDDNTMCKYCGVNSTNCGSEVITRKITDDSETDAIVDKHNELRRKVAKGEESKGTTGPQPPASNMNELVWDDEVARMAQTWADQCAPTSHDTNRNMVDGSSKGLYCGQNVYNSFSTGGPKSSKTLAKAVQSWYDEVKDFDNSAVENFFGKDGGHTGVVGHYTQVIWGDVSTVGCGYMYRVDESEIYKFRETVVCNYCKGGNYFNSSMYKTGDPASNCPIDHPSAHDGLCKK